jgi:hypothetical protein
MAKRLCVLAYLHLRPLRSAVAARDQCEQAARIFSDFLPLFGAQKTRNELPKLACDTLAQSSRPRGLRVPSTVPRSPPRSRSATRPAH